MFLNYIVQGEIKVTVHPFYFKKEREKLHVINSPSFRI